jgi:streptomycin 6-kinase
MDHGDMDLAARLRACVRRWHLQSGDRLSGGFRSEVVGCTTASGDEVVVKLTVTPEEARAEAAALTAWAHTGAAPRPIDVDFEHSALLLARIRPGTHLPGGNDPLAVNVAAGLLSSLHRVNPGTFPFPALEKIYVRMADRARSDAEYEQRTRGDPARGAAGVQRLEAARAAAKELYATTGRTVLLHGDFLDKNLLWDGARYLAIDPIPCIGDPCADAGFFAAGHPPATMILQRADAIAVQMGVSRQRAQRWAAVWTVLETCSAWREDQSDLDACLSSYEFEHLIRR